MSPSTDRDKLIVRVAAGRDQQEAEQHQDDRASDSPAGGVGASRIARSPVVIGECHGSAPCLFRKATSPGRDRS